MWLRSDLGEVGGVRSWIPEQQGDVLIQRAAVELVFGPGNDLMETQTDKLRRSEHKLKLSLTHLQQVAQCAGGLSGSSDTVSSVLESV